MKFTCRSFNKNTILVMSKLWIFLVLGFILYVEAQEERMSRDWRSRRRRPHSGGRGGHGIPRWCPRRSPRLRCFVNPCDVDRCPSYPDAICINDNPCEPSCEGSFYTEGRGRLSRRECNGQGHTSPGIPGWCPLGSPRIRCFASPCDVMTCPSHPDAKCIADNPCEPSCSGDFYLRRRRRGRRARKLTRAECAADQDGRRY